MARGLRSRLRWAAKWSGTVLCLSVALLWLGTGFRSFDGSITRGLRLVGVGAYHGCAVVIYATDNDPVVGAESAIEWGLHTDPGFVPAQWLPSAEWFRGASAVWAIQFTVPLWTVLALGVPPTVALWWRDRRSRPGHCPCGYDLTGLAPDAPCPECGRKAVT